MLRSGQPSLSVIALVTVASMLLLGFSEEVMFRGIVLQAGLRRFGPAVAVLLSAIVFTLMHVVNLLAVLGPIALLQQLSFVFFFGIAMACIALRANSFLPLMAFHGLWDTVQFLGRLWQADFAPFYVPAIALNAVMAGMLWVSLARHKRAA